MQLIFSPVILFTHWIIFLSTSVDSTFINLADDVDCGVAPQIASPSSIRQRIVGGVEAQLGEFPWMASIMKRNYRNQLVQYCGGVVINKKWVLTAAHGFHLIKNYAETVSTFFVIIGERDMGTIENRLSDVQALKIKKIFVHPSFYSAKQGYDMALLYLDGDINWNPFAQPICVASNPDVSLNGEIATVAGWGRIPPNGNNPRLLQTVSFPIVANSECQQWFDESDEPGLDVAIHDGVMCAGVKEGGKGTCTGDSGGPLMVKDNKTERFITAGIASLGVGCARPNLPRTFTSTAKYIDWIIETIEDTLS